MDLQHAKTEFEHYLDGYDRNDDKVHLKIVHTYGVTEYSRQIAERLNLPDEDRELAQLIGLLHDIGRFEQLKRFDSFDPNSIRKRNDPELRRKGFVGRHYPDSNRQAQ